jgi:hypothetical protein
MSKFSNAITIVKGGSEIKRSLRVYDDDASNYVKLQSPAGLTPSIVYTLPNSVGNANDVLFTTGNGILVFDSIGSRPINMSNDLTFLQAGDGIIGTEVGGATRFLIRLDTDDQIYVGNANNVLRLWGSGAYINTNVAIQTTSFEADELLMLNKTGTGAAWINVRGQDSATNALQVKMGTTDDPNWDSGFIGTGTNHPFDIGINNIKRLRIEADGTLKFYGNANQFFTGTVQDGSNNSAFYFKGAGTNISSLISEAAGSTSIGKVIALYGGQWGTNRIEMYHDGSTGLLETAAGDIVLKPAGGDVSLAVANTAFKPLQGGRARIASQSVNVLQLLANAWYDGSFWQRDNTLKASWRCDIDDHNDRIMLQHAGATTGTISWTNVLWVAGQSGYFGLGVTPQTRLHIKGSSDVKNPVLFLQPYTWTAAGDYGELRFGDANHYIRGEYNNGMTIYDTNQITLANAPVIIEDDLTATDILANLSQSGDKIRIKESGGLNNRGWNWASMMFDLTNVNNNTKRGISMDIRTTSSTGTINTGGIAISIYTPPDNGGDVSGIWVQQTGGGNAISIYNLSGNRPSGYTQYANDGYAIEATVDGTKHSIRTHANEGSALVAEINDVAGSNQPCMHAQIWGSNNLDRHAIHVRSTTAGDAAYVDFNGNVWLKSGAVVKCTDNNHAVKFRQSENILELYEYGDIYLTPNVGSIGGRVNFANAATAGSAGSLAGYLEVKINGTAYKIPYYNLA